MSAYNTDSTEVKTIVQALGTAGGHLREVIFKEKDQDDKRILRALIDKYEALATKLTKQQEEEAYVVSLVAKMDAIVKSNEPKGAAIKQWRDCWLELKSLIGFDAAFAIADVESGLELLDRVGKW